MPFQTGAETIINSVLGIDATYTPPGGGAPVSLRIIIEKESDQFPGDFRGPTNADKIKATFLTSTGIDTLRGGTIITSTQRYRVEGRPVQDDYLTTVTVKHG